MCQLFSISSNRPQEINDFLKLFYAKSANKHAHGWGIGVYQDEIPFFLKEPKQACTSELCKDLTNNKIVTSLAIAHIRYATRGNLNQENTHPFLKKLDSKPWVFAHNGTVDYPKWELEKFSVLGDTDSEKIFSHILLKLNDSKTNLDGQDKFNKIAKALEELSPYGKMNLTFTDGENLYVHTNLEKTLYSYKKEGTVMFATEPLEIKDSRWNQVLLNTLLVYKDGREIFRKELKPNKIATLNNESMLNYKQNSSLVESFNNR